jgi:hypothetical protein
LDELAHFRWRLDRGRRVPDPAQPETEDEVGVEDEPASFVHIDGAVSERLADDRKGRGQVEVVVDCGHEPLVEPLRHRGEASLEGMSAIGEPI